MFGVVAFDVVEGGVPASVGPLCEIPPLVERPLEDGLYHTRRGAVHGVTAFRDRVAERPIRNMWQCNIS